MKVKNVLSVMQALDLRLNSPGKMSFRLSSPVNIGIRELFNLRTFKKI